MTTFTTEDREMYPTPKSGDIFTEANGKQFTVNRLFDVEGDSWIEYYNEIKQPFYCKLDAFVSRFQLLNNR
jgi:hypothetical protein